MVYMVYGLHLFTQAAMDFVEIPGQARHLHSHCLGSVPWHLWEKEVQNPPCGVDPFSASFRRMTMTGHTYTS